MKNSRNIIVCLTIVGIIILCFLFFPKLGKTSLDLRKTSNNYRSTEDIVNFLYDRYQVEDGNKFSIVGSNMYQDVDDTYAFYYRDEKVNFSNFANIYKDYILIDLLNYDTYSYDNNRQCYFYSLDEFRNLYKKYYGELNDFFVDTSEFYSPRFYLDDDKICITKADEGKQYSKAIDTYFVNGIEKDNEIIIYERVAFVKIGNNFIDFYSDYSLKDKVYSLDKSKADLSFIHNSKIVSNVLMQYRDKFPIYEYHYKKGESTYYLESISK